MIQQYLHDLGSMLYEPAIFIGFIIGISILIKVIELILD
jgi:hypothetical protein